MIKDTFKYRYKIDPQQDLQNNTGNPTEHSCNNLDVTTVCQRLDTLSCFPESSCCFLTTQTIWEINYVLTQNTDYTASQMEGPLRWPQASGPGAAVPSLEPRAAFCPRAAPSWC